MRGVVFAALIATMCNLFQGRDNATIAEGRAIAATATVALRGKSTYLASLGRAKSGNASRAWLSSLLAVPAGEENGSCLAKNIPCGIAPSLIFLSSVYVVFVFCLYREPRKGGNWELGGNYYVDTG